MDISISLVNTNTKNLVKQFVKNITALDIPLEYEIIIKDNESTDGSVEMIEKELLPQYPQVTLIVSPNRGFGAGHNRGLQGSSAEYVLIVNPDIVMLEDCISALHRFMQEHPKCSIVAPKLVYPDQTTQPSCYAWPTFMTPLYRRTPLGKTIWGMKEIT